MKSRGDAALMWLRRLGAVAAIGLIVGAIAGCGNDSFDDLESLRGAYVDAGGQCDEYEEESSVGLWDEAGSCVDGDVMLLIFPNEDGVDTTLTSLESIVAQGDSTRIGESVIAGANWIILNTSDKAIAEELGGKVRHLQRI